jgi:Concanavalin A-like lectin/glucanases superfamily
MIGGVVEPGIVVSGENRAYRWPAGDLNAKDPGRLVTATGRAFNPREDAFSVTIRLKTAVAADQNIIQKGQAPSPGIWKIEMASSGRVFCFFKGEVGRAAIGSLEGVSLADDAWHTVRCIRRSAGVTIIVDGGSPRTQARATGRIANGWPLTIGGKSQCNPDNNVTCQYYVGDIDRVVVRRR